jgi:hypothetical protein
LLLDPLETAFEVFCLRHGYIIVGIWALFPFTQL